MARALCEADPSRAPGYLANALFSNDANLRQSVTQPAGPGGSHRMRAAPGDETAFHKKIRIFTDAPRPAGRQNGIDWSESGG